MPVLLLYHGQICYFCFHSVAFCVFFFFFDFAASGVREYSSRLRLLLHRAFKCGSGWPFLPLPSSQNRPGPCRPLITVRSNSE